MSPASIAVALTVVLSGTAAGNLAAAAAVQGSTQTEQTATPARSEPDASQPAPSPSETSQTTPSQASGNLAAAAAAQDSTQTEQPATPAQSEPDASQPAPSPSETSQATPPQSQASQTTPSQKDQAKQQLHQEEKQRILGVLPNFSTVNRQTAVPLTTKQKFQLAFHSAIDPFQFVLAGLDAGISQANNDFSGYGQGAAGYAKRFGAAYTDQFSGAIFGNAIYPSLLRQDPRYLRKGTGPFKKRLVAALVATVWTRNDNGTWGFNYSNVLGNLTAGGLANLYYPSSDRGFGLTMQRAATVTIEGALGAVFREFWPDINSRLFHTNP